MSLKIMPNLDGTFRPTWYGRISVKGQKKTTNLNVPIEGTIPVDSKGNVCLSAKGDEDFERSRKAALKAFEAWRRECQKDPAELQAKAYKARTGEDLEGLPLAKLYDYWRNNVIRAKTPSETWCGVIKNWLSRFSSFCQGEARANKKRCETVNDVTLEIASAWFEHVKGAFAWETVSKMKHLVSGVFASLHSNGLARKNPFANIQLRGGGTGENKKISRKALDVTELEKVLECAREDATIYPLVVAAACTGMRLGDVCNLKWADIDLRQGLITCVTAKAGVKVTIPIFGRLGEVLEQLSPVPGDGKAPSPYAFPSAHASYIRNPDGIGRAVKPFFARAVFGDKEPTTDVSENGETQHELADVIHGAGFTEYERNRLMDVYNRFKAGQRSVDIAAALKVARSQVSMDLREIEKLTGQTLRPMAAISAARKTRLDLIEQTRQDRGIGKRAASVYGWHSFRHTFVILALQAGVPVEDVRLIVGHGEAEITLENYYNPEKKHAAENMRKRMQGSVLDGKGKGRKRITAGVPAPVKPNVDDLIAGLTAEQRKELARKLLGL